MSAPLKDLWADFVTECMMSEGYICQLRKFIQGKVWTIPGDVWDEGQCLSLEELGYNPKSKMGQLKRNYYNEESLKAANEKLKSRMDGKKYQTSVAASTQGGKKDERSQGHCMLQVVVTHFTEGLTGKGKHFLTVDIHYRSTELIKKFGADLVFLNQVLIPELLRDIDIPIREVRFYFSNLFVSSLFLPVLYYMKDPVELLQLVEQEDPDFFKKCMMQTKSLALRNFDHYSYRTRREMHHMFLKLCDEGVIDRDGFIQYLKDTGNYILDDEDIEEDDE